MASENPESPKDYIPAIVSVKPLIEAVKSPPMVSRMLPEDPGRHTPIKSAVSPKSPPKFSK